MYLLHALDQLAPLLALVVEVLLLEVQGALGLGVHALNIGQGVLQFLQHVAHLLGGWPGEDGTVSRCGGADSAPSRARV